jgi:hypothetical protein
VGSAFPGIACLRGVAAGTWVAARRFRKSNAPATRERRPQRSSSRQPDIWAQDDRRRASRPPHAEERRELANGGKGNGRSKGITFTEALASANVNSSCQAADVMVTVRDLSASAALGKLGNAISRLQEMGPTPNGHRGNSNSAEDPQTGKTHSRPGKASQGDADLCPLPYAGKRRRISHIGRLKDARARCSGHGGDGRAGTHTN